MSENLFFDFALPPVDPRGGWQVPPHQGTTAAAKKASETGARHVVKMWKERQSIVLQFLSGGPKSRQALVALTGYPISSICSVIGALLDQDVIERTGLFDLQQWSDGRVTLREEFRIKPKQK